MDYQVVDTIRAAGHILLRGFTSETTYNFLTNEHDVEGALLRALGEEPPVLAFDTTRQLKGKNLGVFVSCMDAIEFEYGPVLAWQANDPNPGVALLELADKLSDEQE